MDIHFQYKKQEVIDALRFHFNNRPEMKLFKVVLMLLVAFAFFGYFADYITLKMLVWIFLLFVIMMLFFWYVLPYSVYRRARTFKEPEIRLHLTEETLTIGTKEGESTIPWHRFSHVIETKSFFYLYRTQKSFFLIPTSAFSNRNQRIGCSELLQSLFPNYLFK